MTHARDTLAHITIEDLGLNLSSEISERLWVAVRGTYEAGNYSSAILDAVNCLGDVVRDKSGLPSDGAQLVGAALSGPNPIIRVNSLHTQSDQDEQRGVHSLLLGIYSAIRNPRSHGNRADSAETANAVIYFVDYLLGMIDKARSPFDADQTIGKVFDPLFGQSEKYADLVVAKVPARKLLDIVIQVFHRRAEGPGRNVELFIDSALKAMTVDEQESFWQVVSETLENASSDAEFRTVILVAQRHWDRVSEIARLRTEHRLIESIREGQYNQIKGTCIKGSLGTWTDRIVDEMELKKEYASAVASRITSLDQTARAYAFQYHFDTYRRIQPVPPRLVVNRLNSLLKDNDKATYNALWFAGLDLHSTDPQFKWTSELKDAYLASGADDFAQSAEISDDDIPF
jgi:uncharacterized protein (TIGR02391 family)